MPITAKYDPQTCLLVIEASGVMTVAQLLEVVASLRDHQSGKPLNGILFDQSGVTDVDVTSADIQSLAEVTRGMEQAQGLRMASVAPKDVVFGMSRMYEFVRDDGDNVRSFRDRDSALLWLEDRSAD